jgi:hypothetical protein
MSRYLLFIALPLVAACDVQTKNPANENGEKVAIKADDKGQVAFDLPFAKGNIKLPEGIMRDGDVDIDGVKLMPGSKVTGFSVMSQKEDQSTVDIAFANPARPAEVRGYFAGEFAKKGMTAAVEGDSIKTTTKDGDDVTIAVTPSGSGSTGKITMVDKG